MPDDIGSHPQPALPGDAQAKPAAGNGARRKRLFAILGGIVAAAALLWGGYWLLIGSHYVATDNA